MLQDSASIVAVLFSTVAAALWLCDRYSWARRISALVLILIATSLLSNLGVIPIRSKLYGGIAEFSVPFAVCLVLFGVQLRDLRALDKTMIAGFALASFASVVGVVCAGVSLAGWLSQSVGPEHWKLAGPYAGTYVGGSLNFFALWQGLGIDNPDLFAAANAVDNLTILPLMLVWTTAPKALASMFPATRKQSAPSSHAAPVKPSNKGMRHPTDVAILAACSLAVLAVSEWITTTLIAPHFPQVPSILVVTTVALAVGQLRFIRSLSGAWDMGYLAFYCFFAAVGAGIDVFAAIELSPLLFGYVAIVFVVHMAILFLLGKLFGLSLDVLIIASTATKGGPTLVPSVAQAHGWTSMVLPGILLGLLGYAVGNYIGFGTAYLVQSLT